MQRHPPLCHARVTAHEARDSAQCPPSGSFEEVCHRGSGDDLHAALLQLRVRRGPGPQPRPLMSQRVERRKEGWVHASCERCRCWVELTSGLAVDKIDDRDSGLRDLLLTLSPSARDHLRTVLIRDDRDEIAQLLLRYGDANG